MDSTTPLEASHQRFHRQCGYVSEAVADMAEWDADNGADYDNAQEQLDLERDELAQRWTEFVGAMGERSLPRCCLAAQDRHQLVRS